MAAPILATKLFIPPPRPKVVLRPRLIEQLNEGLQRAPSVIFISAPAGFGKTTLVSEWIGGCGRPAAWLSLDAADSDPARFLTYLIAALQTIAPHSGIGAGLLATLQSSPPPPLEASLTVLLNEVTAGPEHFLLVLDDWHVIEAKAVDLALTFLLEHLPPTLHLVIATREDPHLPLARLRARGQLTELRAADLRFTATEAAEYLNRVMGLDLAPADIASLEDRTEGWIAGLQLAALALRGPTAMSGQPGDAAGFIQAFTGSHRFVLDYLVEEVLQQQSEAIQGFLLRTSILDRLCGPLCDAVLCAPAGSGQNTLERIEKANLFIVPLDNERRWYRYHHLFAELLRQRLAHIHRSALPDETDDGGESIAELHVRASQWYEENGLEIEAFQHAAAANDLDRAARLVEGKGMPLHFRGAAAMVLNWLASLPTPVVEATPALGVMYALALSMTGQLSGIELKLQAAEAALLVKRSAEPDDDARNLIGHIAAIRALLAAAENQAETMITQSQRALEYLHPDNLPVRTTTTWILGWARQLQGDRAAARRAYTEAMAISQTSGNTIVYIWAAGGLGILQEADNQLHQAAQTFRQIVQLVGEPPRPEAGLAYLGLARIYYEWNDLEAAAQHLQTSIPLLRHSVDMYRFVATDLVLASLKLAQGDAPGAAALLAEAEESARLHNIEYWMPALAAAQVQTLLRLGQVAAAAQLAETSGLPLSQARVLIAQGDPAAALVLLASARQQADAKDWSDDRLKVLVLQALALRAHGEHGPALAALEAALRLAELGGLIRTFVDEGPAMAALLREAAQRRAAPSYIQKLLAAFGAANPPAAGQANAPAAPALTEPLSEREREVLALLRTELNGPEMARELSVSLATLRKHTQNIFSKLGVNNRRAAVRRADELAL